MSSALYQGWVRHRRREPVRHDFRYRVFLAWIDLDEAARLGPWPVLSARAPALLWLRRRDHFGDLGAPLADVARDLVAARTGRRPQGPVRLLTHLRTLGHVFNPVSFFYCFAADGESIEAIVADVHNTPWGERHCYVLDPRVSRDARPGRLRFVFPKAFHVSPFMPMPLLYDWRFTAPGERLAVHMVNEGDTGAFFDATMVLRRKELSTAALLAALVRFPLLTLRVVAAIYVQAARLGLKGAPFHPHPGRAAVRLKVTR